MDDELNLPGLDTSHAPAIDQVDIEDILPGSLNGSGEFNNVDAELLKLMAQDGLSPTPADTDVGYGRVNLGSPTIDGLANFEIPLSSQELEPDPLLNIQIRGLRNQQQQNNIGNHNLLVQQHQQRQAQIDLNSLNIPEPNPMMDRGLQQMMPNGMPIQQQQMGQNNMQRDRTIEQLEHEKMQLLAKLNEIRIQQGQMSSPMTEPIVMQSHPQDQLSHEQLLLLQLQQQQQQQQQPNIPMTLLQPRQQQLPRTRTGLGDSQGSKQNSTLASAVAGMSVKDPGETPLTIFLRNKGGGGGGGASVFSSKGRASVDPYNSRGKLSGAMDRSTETHALIKQLGLGRTGGKSSSSRSSSNKNGNEQFGSSRDGKSGYKFSGILSKHASDGHLLRTSGMTRSNSKTSLSRDNLLYGLSRSKSRAGSQSKEQLNRLTKKPSSSKIDMLRREESFGSIPRKGRSTGVSKFKYGGSTGNLGSFSNLGSLGKLDSFAKLKNAQRGKANQGAPGGDIGANGKYQGNAQW